MKIVETELNGVLIVEPDVFGDERGYFIETYQQKRYRPLSLRTASHNSANRQIRVRWNLAPISASGTLF